LVSTTKIKGSKEIKLRRDFHSNQRQDVSALNLGSDWNVGWRNCVFDVVWKAYDQLLQYYKDGSTDAKKQSEDEITTALLRFTKIVRGSSPARFEPLDFVNQPPDKSKTRNRKNNTNDIGVFFGDEIEKPAFIFESKKISTLTEKGIKPYKEDLDAYLEEYYGSHLSESALITYLHKGAPDKMFDLVTKVIKTKLKQFSVFASRPHKTSKHKKTVKNPIQKDFLCHHLVFEMM
jgi:hypothetical protein